MDCQDYHCKCETFEDDGNGWGYCLSCSCLDEDHGQGFRAQEQADADEGHAAVRKALGERLNLN